MRNLQLTDRTHRTRQLFGSECEGSVLKLGDREELPAGHYPHARAATASFILILPVTNGFVHVDLAEQANIDLVAFGINHNILFDVLANS